MKVGVLRCQIWVPSTIPSRSITRLLMHWWLACTPGASLLRTQKHWRNTLASTARKDWRGVYDGKFAARMKVCLTDAERLAQAMEQAAEQVKQLATAATEEQQRRDVAKKYEYDHGRRLRARRRHQRRRRAARGWRPGAGLVRWPRTLGVRRGRSPRAHRARDGHRGPNAARRRGAARARLAHAGGNHVDFAWDGDRIGAATCSDGRSVVYRYDELGHLVEAERDGAARRDAVDEQGRIVSVSDADGVVEVVNSYDD
jgi:hypothetical protein